MSKLEQLIEELCPDGVEYKTLGEIATEIYRGSGITRNQVTTTGIPCVRYGEIYTTYNIWFENCVSHTDEKTISNIKHFEYGDILFAITGESVAEIAKSCVYIGNNKCLAGGDIVVMKHQQDPKYLSYALSTTEAQQQKSKGKVKSKVVHSSIPALKEIIVPVPPLAIQREIVRILDNFTELTKELTKELTARKTQYEYYRNELLMFDDNVKYKMLGEICDIKNGYTPLKANSEYWKNGTIPWFRMEDIRQNGRVLSDSVQHITTKAVKCGRLFSENSIVIATTATVGEHALITVKSLGNQQLTFLTIKEVNKKVLHYKFLFYYCFILDNWCKVNVKGGGLPAVDMTKFAKFKIPLPPLTEQLRIISILDRFDTLTNDISNGLPAEIKARRKQYEYYRDKLLTFK